MNLLAGRSGFSPDAAPRAAFRALLGSRAAYVGLAVGIAVFTAVIAWQGLGDVTAALAQAGWAMLALALFHVPPLAADALGWRGLFPPDERPPRRSFFHARWIGESINDLLPVLQMGGNVVKAWLLVGRGTSVGRAGATVVVDVTLVVLTQILFTFLGLALLAPSLYGARAVAVVLAGSAIMALLLAGFYAAQRRGFLGLVARLAKRILGRPEWTSFSEGASRIDAEVLRIYADRPALLRSAAWHVLAWFLGIGEVWFALRILGREVDLRTALLFESLGQAIRTGAFAVPGAIGVQEGGYVLVGGALGIEPSISIALSLSRRVRELLLGVPGLAAWQAPALVRLFGGRAGVAGKNPGPDRPPAPDASGPSGPGRWEVDRSAIVRAINAGGLVLGRFARAALNAEDLMAAARRHTGLEDFGEPSFREPLDRLIESLEAEARLNTMGRLATRHDLIRLLANRLRMTEDRRRNPGIAGEEIRAPVFITGLPRTGTTLLHNLLALDLANRVPLTWETIFPSPPPEAATYRTDRRIAMVDAQIRWFRRLLRGFERIHPVGTRLPEECLVIFSHSFLSWQFETTHRLPAYLAWLEDQDLRPAYEVHRRFLQHLQSRCPGRWVLKAPAHLFDLRALFSVYPDAIVIMTHRNPLEVAASNASLTAHLRSAFTDEVDPREIGPECSRRWAEAVARGMRFRDAGGAPADRFLDLRYADLIADPAGTVREVYARFGLPFPPELEGAIRAHVRRSPEKRFGKHRYTLEEFALDRDEEEERYAAYRRRYGV